MLSSPELSAVESASNSDETELALEAPDVEVVEAEELVPELELVVLPVLGGGPGGGPPGPLGPPGPPGPFSRTVCNCVNADWALDRSPELRAVDRELMSDAIGLVPDAPEEVVDEVDDADRLDDPDEFLLPLCRADNAVCKVA